MFLCGIRLHLEAEMIHGHLKFEKPDPVQAGRRVTIIVEDTSRVDAEAVRVAQIITTLPETFDFEHDVLPFKIDVIDDTDTLTIRAHMPCHSDTDIRLGDMITMEAIPVRRDADIAVTLHRVD